MNLERVSNEEKLELCRKYYLGVFYLSQVYLRCVQVYFTCPRWVPAVAVPVVGERALVFRCCSPVQVCPGVSRCCLPVWLLLFTCPQVCPGVVYLSPGGFRCCLPVQVYFTCPQVGSGVFYLSRCILPVPGVSQVYPGVFYLSRCILPVQVYFTCPRWVPAVAVPVVGERALVFRCCLPVQVSPGVSQVYLRCIQVYLRCIQVYPGVFYLSRCILPVPRWVPAAAVPVVGERALVFRCCSPVQVYLRCIQVLFTCLQVGSGVFYLSPGGFLLLPFLWLVNVLWFFREAFLAPPFGEQPRIKRYVLRSAVGAALWGLGLGVWVGLFQSRRSQWGALGDALSFTQPMGEP
ncbi:gamma-secretase subunit PEN-2 isoform X1 [Poecile atricapillus]|uniref:gamma-secretase subunit PEN-2 isoform X1 n=1 Tax=Poecile atricapillus TaxID=48891 RepID=UPI0027384296|nr:gamma-secretase subunit PEN-2 isoform X1 [Poecile atricapillus]